MGKIKEGAKAGVVAGIIYGIIATIVTVSLEYVFKSGILSAISGAVPPGTATNLDVLYYSTIVGSIIVGMVFSIILGLLLGIILGAFSERIPGKTLVVKGMVLGFLSWIFVHLCADVLNLRYGLAFYIAAVSIGLATLLFYGALLGTFFGQAMKTKTRRRSASRT